MMKQDQVQKTILWLVLVLAVVLVLVAVMNSVYPKQYSPEKYSPYGSRERTGFPGLDIYERQDYYKEHPYIYPTPQSYLTAWYKLERQQQKQFQALMNKL